MKFKYSNHPENDDLFRSRLNQMINVQHALVLLANRIDWAHLDEQLVPLFATTGRPAISSRLMIGLHLLKHIYRLSDEAVCQRWVENPYYQYFCGET